MRTTVFRWLTLTFAAAVASSVVSMMASFVGAAGEDLRDLLLFQVFLVPVAIGVTAGALVLLSCRFGFRSAVTKLWAALPAWLILLLLLVNSLVLIAELSFALLQFHSGDGGIWQEHIPAAAALCSSIATAVCYAGMRLGGAMIENGVTNG